MNTAAAIVFAGLTPHPPVIVPAVGKGRERDAAATVDAMRAFAKAFMGTSPDHLVLISPHSPRRPNAFGCWAAPILHGDFTEFRAEHCKISVAGSGGFLDLLRGEADQLEFWPIPESGLDHGALVPLHYLIEAGWWGETTILGLNYPGDGQLEELGEAIGRAARAHGGRVALVASGDMSHRLFKGAPGGYHPQAADFDASFVDALRDGDASAAVGLSQALTQVAGEDVIDSCKVVLSAIKEERVEPEVLSYEGPFGVGYCVATFLEKPAPKDAPSGQDLVRIARTATESFVRTGERIAPPVAAIGYLARRAGVFVTVRRKDGSLRGCIGVLEATEPNLVEQVIDRSMAVARWAYGGPLTDEELDDLTYDVSVLHPAELVGSAEELNPEIYGVIMRDDGGKRAVLLPGIESIETVDEQLSVVRRKAGIEEGARVRLWRFRTDFFEE